LITKKFALGKTPMQSNQPKACLEEGGGVGPQQAMEIIMYLLYFFRRIGSCPTKVIRFILYTIGFQSYE